MDQGTFVRRVAELREAGVTDAQIAIASGRSRRTIQVYASRGKITQPAVTVHTSLRRIGLAHARLRAAVDARQRLSLPDALVLVFYQPVPLLMRSAARALLDGGLSEIGELAPYLEVIAPEEALALAA